MAINQNNITDLVGKFIVEKKIKNPFNDNIEESGLEKVTMSSAKKFGSLF